MASGDLIERDEAPGAAAFVPALTGLRGIAALWVFSFHLQGIARQFFPAWLPDELYLLRTGWVGVDLFFLLSGFMLMNAPRRDFHAPDRRGVAAFFLARFVRVYPLSFVALLLIALLVWLDPAFAAAFSRSTDSLSAGAFVRTALLATRWTAESRGDWNQPIWSLSAEVLGYAAFPVLAWAIGRLQSRTLALAAAGAGMLFVYVSCSRSGIWHGDSLDNPYALLRMAGYFTAGICLRRAADFGRTPSRAVATAVLCLAVLSIPILALRPIGAAAMPIAFAAILLGLFVTRTIVSDWLSSPVAMFLGRISFPLYLIHVMPLTAYNFHAKRLALGGPAYCLGLAAYVAAVFGVAWLLHRYVERPLHRRARRWSSVA